MPSFWKSSKKLKIGMQATLGLIKDDLAALHSVYSKAKKGGEELTAAEEQALISKLKTLHKQQVELEKRMAQEPSLWCADFTGEALGVLLANNREQVSVSSDERSLTVNNLLGVITTGRQPMTQCCVKVFTVNAHKVHRISRESISLKKPCISVLLLVQEDIRAPRLQILA